MGTSINKVRVPRKSLGKLKKVRIRAFKASDDQFTSQRFLDSHLEVLANHGFENLVSSKGEWISRDNVYLIVIESTSGHKVYGGVRIHVYDKENKLPIQKSLRHIDSKIDDVVEKLHEDGCAELCAMWNSLETASIGVSSEYLVRLGISLMKQIGIKYMFGLTSPLTVKMMKRFGFDLCDEVGDSGSFPYPTDKMKADLYYYTYPESMDFGFEEERSRIIDLIEHPIQKKSEEGRRGKVEVNYSLLINSSKGE